MNKEESLTLFAAGAKIWNEWAADMIAQRKSLEDAGTWAIRRSPGRGIPGFYDEGYLGLNTETSNWLNAANVDFEGHLFDDAVDFTGFCFPDRCTFSDAIIVKEAKFNSAIFNNDVIFRSTHFQEDASFRNTTFRGSARFYFVEFDKDGDFSGAQFDDEATFDGSIFTKRGWFDILGGNFRPVVFAGDASFNKVKFGVGCGFTSAKFIENASFHGVNFGQFSYFENALFTLGAYFRESTFGGWINFQKSTFNGPAIFDYIIVTEGAQFELKGIHFGTVPSFFGTQLSLSPRVDDLQVKVHFGGLGSDPDTSARFRVLKGFAIANRDHDRELEFFAQEVRTARFHQDGLATQRFWLGLIYELTSNFGRSLARPLLIWLVSVFLFAIYYLGETPIMKQRLLSQSSYFSKLKVYWDITKGMWGSNEVPCLDGVSETNGQGDNAISYAVALSRRNALVLPGIGRAAEDTQIYRCLYGVSQSQVGGVYPVIPLTVSFWSTVQTVFSGLLLFLCGLGLRNTLRLK